MTNTDTDSRNNTTNTGSKSIELKRSVKNCKSCKREGDKAYLFTRLFICIAQTHTVIMSGNDCKNTALHIQSHSVIYIIGFNL